ncbi:leucine-rich repeat domain-containing protein [Marinicellulosiphila megalodicopiae]|uniref:leucine-rich repeat domain-containing protein n=1 Tax=Marinicellulosiphila megalodicopiae TaxID=2724896 RepID=UPI003BB15139
MNIKQLLSLTTFSLVAVFFNACGDEKNQTSNTTSVSFDGKFSSIISKVSVGRALTVDTLFKGTMTVTNLDDESFTAYPWSVYVGDDFSTTSNETIALTPGNYQFDLVLNKNNQTYIGIALHTIEDAGVYGNVPMTIKPVIGNASTQTEIEARLAAFKFNFPADELTAVGATSLNITIDGTTTTTLTLSQGEFLNDSSVWHVLDAQAQNIHLELYNGNQIIGHSVLSQELQTVQYGQNITMDIIPLSANVAFEMDETTNTATFEFTLPQEVLDEVGGAENLQTRLQISGDNNQDIILDGSEIAFNEFQYGEANIVLTYSDIQTGDVIGSCIIADLTLDNQTSTNVCQLTLTRRSEISGSLLADVVLNVYANDGQPATNASVYVDGEFVGLTGAHLTTGALQLYLSAGEHVVYIEGQTHFNESTIITEALSVNNLFITLDESLVVLPTFNFTDVNLENCILESLGLNAGDVPTTEQMLSMNSISCVSKNITSLSGLEDWVHVKRLVLRNNKIESLSPLSNMMKLNWLWVGGNNISNISDLPNYPELMGLQLNDNELIDITALARQTSVQSLSLNKNEIMDVSPISELINLTYLDISYNNVTDLLPLDKLVNITNLNISSNNISDINTLSNLIKITNFSANENSIVDISVFSFMMNLQNIVMLNNDVIDLAPLTNLKYLSYLHMQGNNIVDVSSLAGLSNLTTLWLLSNDIEDISMLSGAFLNKLIVLNLGANNISNINSLSSFTSVKNLIIGGNPIVSLQPISNLISLTSLDVSSNVVLESLDPIAGLVNLTNLNIAITHTDDLTILYNFPELTSLVMLAIGASDITPVTSLVKLKYLNLNNNYVEDLTPLSNLTQLTQLYLSNNKITDVSPLSTLTNLTKLQLNGNIITDCTPVDFFENSGCGE